MSTPEELLRRARELRLQAEEERKPAIDAIEEPRIEPGNRGELIHKLATLRAGGRPTVTQLMATKERLESLEQGQYETLSDAMGIDLSEYEREATDKAEQLRQQAETRKMLEARREKAPAAGEGLIEVGPPMAGGEEDYAAQEQAEYERQVEAGERKPEVDEGFEGQWGFLDTVTYLPRQAVQVAAGTKKPSDVFEEMVPSETDYGEGPDFYAPVQLRRLGLERLAAEVEETLEEKPKYLGHALLPDPGGERVLQRVLKLPTTKAFGNFMRDPEVQRQELAAAKFTAIARKHGYDNPWELPDEEFNRLKAVALDQANRHAARIMGTHSRKGRMTVDLDPEKSIRSFSQGILEGKVSGDDTAYGSFVKLAVAGPLTEGARYVIPAVEYGVRRALGANPEDADKAADERYEDIGQILAPVYAMLTPGGTGMHYRYGDPVIGQKSEGLAGWVTRAGPYAMLWSWMDEAHEAGKDDNLGEAFGMWGGEQHLERLYGGGADVIELYSEFRPATDALVKPIEDSGLSSAILSFGAVAFILFTEPDMLSVGTSGLGKVARVGGAALDITKMSLAAKKGVYLRWIKMLEDDPATGIEKVMAEVAQEYDGDIPRLLMNDAQGAVAAELMARGADLQTPDGLKPVNRTFFDELLGIMRQADDNLLKAQTAEGKTIAAGKKVAGRVTKRADAVVRAEEELDITRLDEAQRVLALAQAELVKSAREMFGLARITPQGQAVKGAAPKKAAGTAFDATSKAVGEDGVLRMAEQFAKEMNNLKRLDKSYQLALQQRKTLIAAIGSATNPAQVATLRGQMRTLQARITQLWADRHLVSTRLMEAQQPAALITAVRKFNQVMAATQGLRGYLHRVKWRAGTGPGAKASAGLSRGKLARELKAADDTIAKVARAVDEARTNLDAARATLGKAATKVVKAGDKVTERMSGVDALDEVPDILLRVLKARLGQVDNLRQLRLDKADKVRALKAGESVVLAKTESTSDGLEAALRGKYGDEAYDHATKMLGNPLDGSRVLDEMELNSLFKFEQSMKSFSETARLAPTAPVQAIVDSLKRGPVLGGRPSLKSHSHIRRMLALQGYLERTFGNIASRGFAGMPEFIQEVQKQTINRIYYGENALNKITAKAHRVGTRLAAKAGLEGDKAKEFVLEYVAKEMRRFITTHHSFEVNGVIEPYNKGAMPVAELALDYLRMLANTVSEIRADKLADDSMWTSDPSVQAIARAFIPSTTTGSAAAAAGARRLLKLIRDNPDMTGATFYDEVFGAIRASTAQIERRTDAAHVALAFISRGFVNAAAYNEWVYDLHRVVGMNLSSKAANALNFLTSAKRLDMAGFASAGKELQEGLEELATFTPQFGTPLHQQLSTGIKTLSGGIKTQNELMKLAEIEGHGIYIPRQLKEAMDAIPNRIAKELEEYGSAFEMTGNPAWRYFMRVTNFWKIHKVAGSMIPRWAFGPISMFGNYTQAVTTLGWGTAARLTAENWHNYMPFIGPFMQRMYNKSGKVPWMRALISPGMSRLMRGDEKMIVKTAEGKMNAPQFLREALKDGAQDSIVTDAVGETLRRTQDLGRNWFWEMMTLKRASPWAESWTRQIERAELQMRLQIYYEARTGKLTGTPMSRVEAKKQMLETMFDWRLGMTKWEAESVARSAAFYSYTRGMIVQTGSIFAEALTTPTAKYIPMALQGRTKLARFRQFNLLNQNVGEMVMWKDPDSIVDDDSQEFEFYRRIAPFWSAGRTILTGRRVDPERVVGYDRQGRAVTYEHIILAGTTAADQFGMFHMLTNLAWASAIASAESMSEDNPEYAPQMAADWEEAFKAVVDWTVDQSHPAAESAIGGMVRAVTGVDGFRESSRGVLVDKGTAMVIKIMGLDKQGWLDVYTDDEGQLRYEADEFVLPMAASLIDYFLPAIRESQNVLTTVGNPAMSSSFKEGFLEAFAGFIGLYRTYGSNPEKAEFFFIQDKENRLERAVKQAQTEAGQR